MATDNGIQFVSLQLNQVTLPLYKSKSVKIGRLISKKGYFHENWPYSLILDNVIHILDYIID